MSANLPTKTVSILIVEDSLEWQEILVEIFADSNYFCVPANSVNDAIEKLRYRSFNLAILDMFLTPNKPGGLRILQWLIDNGRDTKVIFCTGYGTIDMERTALRSGKVIGFLSKVDFTDDQLKSMVDEAVN